MSGEGKIVCVTGGSGYIASWLVKLLLQHGYTVKATVRDPYDVKKTQHLLELDGAKERLQLMKAELLEEGCFDSVVEGCHGVFHTASPVSFSSTDPQVELIDPAMKGTLNVLTSCAKVSSIKRVVLTSSIATILYNGTPLSRPQVMVDESWQSDVDFCRKSKLWYMVSKILAEEGAVEFAKHHGIDLVIMNPGFVIGPPLQPTLNFSLEIILEMINGNIIFPGSDYRLVDVRDVASAHIQAFEIDSACGKYCLVAQVLSLSQVLYILHQQFPAYQHLPRSEENINGDEPRCKVSKEKAKTLGINFIPVEVSLRDTVDSLKQHNLLKI